MVLDEADEMLDMGFAEDIESILPRRPGAQTVLFSATLPPRIAAIAKRHLTRPGPDQDRGRAGGGGTDAAGPPDRVHRAPRAQAGGARPGARRRGPPSAIVFCRRAPRSTSSPRRSTRAATAEALHGGMTQEQRNR